MHTIARSIQSNRRASWAQAGQSLVEVALVLPVLLGLVLGAIEFGRFAYLAILVGDAAHAGALYGAQSNVKAADSTGITSAADNDYQNNGQNVSTLTVTTWQTCGYDSAGTYTQLGNTQTISTACSAGTIDPITYGREWVVTVSVEAVATFKPLFSYPWIPSSVKIDRTATMRVEND